MPDIRKNKDLFSFLLIWAFCATAAFYIRLYPLWGHIWSPSNEQATMTVIFNIKKTFLEQIHAQYPQMPFAQADHLASEKLNETLHKDSSKVQGAIEKINQTIHQQSGSPNDPIYLLEADPFYYYNLTENITRTGRIADVIKGNKYFNPLMGAPFGYWQPLTIHPYVGFLIYKAIQLFHPDASLMSAVAFTPVLVTILGLLAFCWCARLLSLSWPAVLLGCFYLGMAPIFLKRSALGWYDTDPYNILFPFLFLGIFFKGIQRKPLLYGGLLAVTLTLYSLLWQGWVFLFFMAFLCAFACAFTSVRNNAIKLTATYVAGALIAGLAIYGLDFFSFFTEGLSELMKFTVKGMSLWPNLFIEVGELEGSSWKKLIADVGGPILVIGVASGLWHGLRRFSPQRLIVAVFLTITIILTFKAERFSIFTLIPLSLFFGLGAEWALMKLRPRGAIWTMIPVVILLAIAWGHANQSIRTILTPIYNDAWDDALTDIKIKTPSDSIVNTWWSPGHFIKAMSHRKVCFDGASLSEGATGYWMANIFLSTDEDKARGLLRMLNLSGNKAVEYLTGRGMTTSQAVALIHLIAPQSTAQARKTLQPFIPNTKDLEHLLMLTHGGAPHSYVLVYNELADENIGLTFVGRRNMKKIEEINADPQLLSSIPPPDSPAFISFLWGLSGGPSKYSDAFPVLQQDTDHLSFGEGLNIKRDMSMATVNSTHYGQGIPLSIVFLKDGHVVEKELPNANLNYSVMVYAKDGDMTARLMDRDLANSLIMKMFYYNGAGLKDFKLTKSSNDLTGRTQIKVFEVLWN